MTGVSARFWETSVTDSTRVVASSTRAETVIVSPSRGIGRGPRLMETFRICGGRRSTVNVSARTGPQLPARSSARA